MACEMSTHVLVDPATGKAEWATSQMRWLVTEQLDGKRKTVSSKRLQQLWHMSGGKSEWRDVPVVEAE
jgi:hypothetical protein